MNEGYEIRGWLNGVKDGTCEVEEAEEYILSLINHVGKRNYSEAVLDAIRLLEREANKTSSDEPQGTFKTFK